MPDSMTTVLTDTQRQALSRLLLRLIDQAAARVLIEPLAPKTGFWFGGGNMVQDERGVLWLCGRYRNFGDSRLGLAAGQRGLEIAIFRSVDGGQNFEKVLSWSKPELSHSGADVVSFEGTSLHRRTDGVWELFFSSEKTRSYPPQVAEMQKPGTGVWSIDAITGPSPDALDAETMVPVLANDHVPEYLHVKDPVVYNGGNGDTHLLFCSHPYSWSSTNTGLAIRPAGGTSFHVVAWEVVSRGAAWDVAATRITCRIPVPQTGLFAGGPPMTIYLYDGAECLRSHQENVRAVRRPRGYSCEEIGGAFVGLNDDYATLARLSGANPLFVSPYGTGASRYADVLQTEEGWHATWEQSQSNNSQPLVWNFVPRHEIQSILGGE